MNEIAACCFCLCVVCLCPGHDDKVEAGALALLQQAGMSVFHDAFSRIHVRIGPRKPAPTKLDSALHEVAVHCTRQPPCLLVQARVLL